MVRLIIHAFSEQFVSFLVPLFECLNRRFVVERPLWNAVVVELDAIAQQRRELGG
jgi:hypothetical protein